MVGPMCINERKGGGATNQSRMTSDERERWRQMQRRSRRRAERRRRHRVATEGAQGRPAQAMVRADLGDAVRRNGAGPGRLRVRPRHHRRRLAAGPAVRSDAETIVRLSRDVRRRRGDPGSSLPGGEDPLSAWLRGASAEGLPAFGPRIRGPCDGPPARGPAAMAGAVHRLARRGAASVAGPAPGRASRRSRDCRKCRHVQPQGDRSGQRGPLRRGHRLVLPRDPAGPCVRRRLSTARWSTSRSAISVRLYPISAG